ncbi:MAG: hypothetical protein AAB587_01030 [Patescibacteria group bacterium]
MEVLINIIKRLVFFIAWPIVMSFVTLQSFRPKWEVLIEGGIVSKVLFIILSPIFIVSGGFLFIVFDEWEKLGE